MWGSILGETSTSASQVMEMERSHQIQGMLWILRPQADGLNLGWVSGEGKSGLKCNTEIFIFTIRFVVQTSKEERKVGGGELSRIAGALQEE